ncbi:MAG TPA: carboxymuconolactone decarboxylase family protein [Burkholderiaceae bacterium]|nr:carboxymuconolactone decarboxylase family protein [Burkholderiaceae bacterium]
MGENLRSLFWMIAIMTTDATAQQRLPTIPPAQYSDEQKKAADEFLAARKMPLFGPFEPMMHSPQLMNQARAMGDYLRYHAAIGEPLSEFAILVIAREWSQDYEWFVHYPLALKAGVKPEMAQAIAEGRRPPEMSEDQDTVYSFLTELSRNKQVSNPTFNRALGRFGSKGVVDLTGLSGYYTLLAMQLNVARYPIPKDARPLTRMP